MSELTAERVKEIRGNAQALSHEIIGEPQARLIVQLCDALLASRTRAEKAEAEAAAMRKTLEEFQRYISYGEYPHLYDLLDATLSGTAGAAMEKLK